MFSKLGLWLQPVQLADEHQTRIAALLRPTLFAFIFLFFVFVPTRILLLGQSTFINYSLLFMFIILGIIYLYLWHLVRLGRTKLVSWCVCLSHFSLITALVLYIQMPLNLIILQYMLTIILTSLLLSRQVTIIFTVVISICWFLIAQMLLEAHNYLVFINLEMNNLVSLLSILLLCAGFMSFLQTTLTNNVTLAKQQQATLVTQRRTLQKKRESLQTEIQNRTHSLTETIHEAQVLQTQLEEVLWIMAGRSWLNKALQGEQPPEHLAQQTVYALCQYLKLPAGAFFVQEKDQFVYYGGFAYVPNKEGVEAGELIQTAVQAPHLQILPKSSPHALSIDTGLTQIIAPHTLLMPIPYENNLLGIVLLASLTPFPEQTKQLCQQASPSIATTLHMVLMQQKISTLSQERL